MYSNRLLTALQNLLQCVVRFFHQRSSCTTTHISADVQRITLNASCMTISDGRTKQLNVFCRVTGFTSDFLSFIVVELIWFFHGALQFMCYCCMPNKDYLLVTYSQLHVNTPASQSIILTDVTRPRFPDGLSLVKVSSRRRDIDNDIKHIVSTI